MATHNPKESRLACRPTLEYIYRGEGHEHSVTQIKHLGGNLFSQNPIVFYEAGNLLDMQLDQMEKEFNAQAALHRGKGEKLYKHYVISLAPNEELSPPQWLEMINEYMRDLGYDSSTKWVAVEHSDSHCKHVHILSCLVKNDRSGSLVKTNNDYEKGWSSMRKYEAKFDLQILQNPDNNFGHNYTKNELKGHCSRADAITHDDASVIRARVKNLFESSKPKTMKSLVEGLAKRGVAVKLSITENGEIQGINYSLDGIKWISGSKVKKSRLTWRALQDKENISYEPMRDDAALGLISSEDCTIEIMIRLREEYWLFYVKKLKFEIDVERKQAYIRLRYRLADASLFTAVLKLIVLLLSIIFGIDFSNSADANEENMEDFELTINPTRKTDIVQTIDIMPESPVVKTIEGLYKKLFNKAEATEAEFEAAM